MTSRQAEMCRQLMNALYHDDFSTINNLLSQGVNVNLPYNHNGWTPFMWVCKEHCNAEVIQLFLAYGGNVNSKNKAGETPLHIMAKHRSAYNCLLALIENGANPNAQDNNGNTPLMVALSHPQVSMRMAVIGNLLLLRDLSIKNNNNETAYDIAKANIAFEDKRFLETLQGGNND